MRVPSVIASFALTSIALMTAGIGLAQDDGFGGAAAPATPVEFRPASEAPQYGTAGLTGLLIGSLSLTPRQGSTTWTTSGGGDRFMPAGGFLQASPVFPNGAQVERIELEACDTSATEQVEFQFGPCANPGAVCNLAGTVATGAAATPGCGFFSATLASPLVVNNTTTFYLASVTPGTSAAASVAAVRMFYRLRVSPAPVVATFGDVPTSHPFFRFVEALASAGITGGCGSGNYCPDNAVTRGQMAVFLSVALGLHFPN